MRCVDSIPLWHGICRRIVLHLWHHLLLRHLLLLLWMLCVGWLLLRLHHGGSLVGVRRLLVRVRVWVRLLGVVLRVGFHDEGERESEQARCGLKAHESGGWMARKRESRARLWLSLCYPIRDDQSAWGLRPNTRAGVAATPRRLTLRAFRARPGRSVCSARERRWHGRKARLKGTGDAYPVTAADARSRPGPKRVWRRISTG